MHTHPAHYFIKYLLVTQEDISQASINGTLEMYGLAGVNDQYLDKVREEVEVLPAYLAPWDSSCSKTNRWLRQQKIRSLFHPDLSTKEMRDGVLPKPALRRHVEGMLLGRVPEREIAFRLRKLKFYVSDVAISEFRHYFWNVHVMGVSDWVDYLAEDSRKTGTGRTATGQEKYTAALWAGPEVALYRAGIRKELDSKKIMVDVQAELYHTFLEIRSLPLSEKKVSMLSAVARGLARIDERIQAGDTALQDVLKKFEKFKVLKDENKLPALADLAPTGSISRKSRSEVLITRDSS